MNGKKRKERNKNSPLFCALFSLIAATVCCVLAVLCVKGISVDFWERNGWWIILTVSLFFAAYYAFSVVCILKEKGVWFRLLVSGYVLLAFSLTVWFILQKTGFFNVVGDSARLEAYLKKSGAWMPLLYILLQYLQVVLLPIPGFVSTAAGVALFGPFIAMLCSFIGVLLGSLTAFWIGRKLGYKAVSWMVGEEQLDKWLKKVKGKDNLVLTVMFVLPLFPDDILCFVAGLSSMSWQYFTAIVLLARAVGIAGTCYSVNFIPFNTWWGIAIWVGIVALVVAVCVLLYKNMDRINGWFQKKFRRKRKKKSEKDS